MSIYHIQFDIFFLFQINLCLWVNLCSIQLKLTLNENVFIALPRMRKQGIIQNSIILPE
jgi:hypothetical protein